MPAKAAVHAKPDKPQFLIEYAADKDPVSVKKANMEMQEIFNNWKMFDSPQIVQCDAIIPDYNNRGGQPLDLQYLHCDLEPRQEEKGYVEARPKPGLLVKRSGESMQKHIDFNLKLQEGTVGLYPPIQTASVMYTCLGGNHLGASHRGMKSGFVSSITGKTWRVPEGDAALYKAVNLGRPHWILKDGIPDDKAQRLADWLNDDQNENCGTSDGQHLRMVDSICIELSEQCKHVKVSQVIAKFSQRTVLKVNSNTVGAYAKICMEFGMKGGYIEELLQYLARFVNGTDLTCPPAWLDELLKAIDADFTLVRLITIFLQYSGLGRQVMQRPAPDNARFILVPEMGGLGKNIEVLKYLEQFLVWGRTNMEPELSKVLGATRARDSLRQLEINAGLMAYNKALGKDFQTTNVGKISKDKLASMRVDWLGNLVKGNAALVGIPASVGIPLGEKDNEVEGPEVPGTSNDHATHRHLYDYIVIQVFK